MNKLSIPEGYQQVMPYLIVENAAAFMQFLRDVFGAEEKHKAMRTESLIMHGEMQIADCVIMFADATEQFPARPGGFFIYVEDADETYKKALAAGAKSLMEPADRPYGRSCGVEDPFGNSWWPTTNAII